MKKNLRSFAALLLLCAVGLSPTFAQTDVTDQYITNPSFEDPNDPTTTGVSATLTGWERTYVDGYNWNGCNGDWVTDGARSYGIWKPAIESDFELSQELALPNGIYTLTVDMTVSKSGTTSRMNGQRMFAGEAEVYYPASAETAADNGAAYKLSITTKVTDGTLKIGIRTDGGTTVGIGWFKVDNFRLYSYEGDDGYLLYCQSQLNNLSNEVDDLLQELPLGNADQLDAIRNEVMQRVEGSEVVEEYEEAIEELTQTIADMKPANEVYLKLLNLINVDCDELKKLNYDGLAEFNAALNAILPIFGTPAAVQEDFEKAIEDVNAAIVTYRFTGFVTATVSDPVDATWLVKNADIEEGTKDWTVNGFGTIGTGNNYDNFAGTFMEKWIAGPATLADYSASQTLTGIPNGIYNLSAAMIACQQSDASITVTGALLFGNSTTQEASTGNGVGERFQLNVVVTDGTLTLGVKTVNTTANWVGFDFVELAYMGMDITSYETAYAEHLATAQSLLGEDILLPKDEKELTAAIAEAEAADRSTIEALEIVLGQLNNAIETAEASIASLKAFKSGSYAKVLAVADNNDGIYAQDLVNLMGRVILDVDGVLGSEETTSDIYPELTEKLDRYMSFVDAYHACDVFAESSPSEDLQSLLTQVLSDQITLVDENESNIEQANEVLGQYLDFAEAYSACEEFAAETGYDELNPMFIALLNAQLEAVSEDIAKIGSAKKLFTSFISFCKAYTLGQECVYDETYPEDKRLVLANECEAERKIVEVDFTNAPEAESRLSKLISETRFDGVIAGNDTEITESAIVNSIIDAPDNNTCPNGWEVDLGNGSNYTYSTGHWSGESVNHFFDSYNDTNGALRYTAKQVIRGIPNGTYKLVAAARADGAGGHVYSKVADGVKMVEIPVYGDTGGEIWKDAEEDSDEKLANNGQGRGWSWVEIAGINVNTNTMTIGCSTDPSVLGGGTVWAGKYFSVDDFKLFWTSTEYSVGVENIGVDSEAGFVAYAENGYIKVEGVDAYSIYTLDGTEIPANAQLVSGIYIVKSGSEAVKVAVK